jgi:hypothetical protein
MRGIVVRMACYVNMKPGLSVHQDGDDATLGRIDMNAWLMQPTVGNNVRQQAAREVELHNRQWELASERKKSDSVDMKSE